MSNRGGLSRRDFMTAAVAIGGASALAACLDREGMPDVEQGPTDLSTLPARQHAWDDVLDRDAHGNVVLPRHHVLLYLDYAGTTTPTDAERETVETALQSLERAVVASNDGLLATIGYSRRYFDRFARPLPDSVSLPRPKPLAPFEDPDPDEPDAVLHLASDHAQLLLAAEQALTGERESLNEVTMEADLSAVFTVADRRTGFVGAGLPREHRDVEGIPDDADVPDDAPMYMGFKSSFEANQASEERVTIEDGPFAGGTTQHISKIRLHLDQWYEQDSRYQRVGKMFCPAHAESGRVEGVGENLGTDTGVDECAETTAADADSGLVGHAQKAARVREDGEPLLLRRDFDSTDDGEAGLHFLSLQQSIEDFVATREAINGTDLADESPVGTRTNNGILQYMRVVRRGNYLLPPRAHRAVPTPDPTA